jgi:carbon storage regulator
MLVISRQRGEIIKIWDPATRKVLATFTVVDIRGDKVRLGVEADKSIRIDRQEIYEQKRLELRIADAKAAGVA